MSPSRRLLLAAALAAITLTAAAPPAAAQDTAPRAQRFPRKYLFGMIGSGIGALAGGTYVAFQGQQQPGTCASTLCVVAVTVSAGGLLGYMIGKEFDELHSLRFRGGAPLTPKDLAVTVQGEPNVLAVRQDQVAVGGSAGVEMFRSTSTVLQPEQRRAAGVRGIAALQIAPPGSLALGSLSGLYVYPPRSGPGTLVREGEVNAVATASDRVFVGIGNRIESVPLGTDTSRSWPGVAVPGAVRDLKFDAERGILWAITDSALVSLRPAGESLGEVGRVAVPSGGRRLSLFGTRLAAAFGEGGVGLVDATDPAAPRLGEMWTGARFSYDVSLTGPRLFVAAGPEGLYVLNVAIEKPAVIGLARELGFAAAVTSDGRYTYVLDRRTGALRRILTDFQP